MSEYIPGTLIEIHETPVQSETSGNEVAGDAPASLSPESSATAQNVASTGAETDSQEVQEPPSPITQTGPSALESTLDEKIDALDADTKAIVHELLMHIGTGFTDIGLAVGMTRISEFVAKVRG